jgi:putative molybdopterin biosynthesis protein
MTEDSGGRHAGTPAAVEPPGGRAGRYYLHDVPLPTALERWEELRRSCRCRERVEAVRLPLERAAGRVTAEPVWAARSSPPFDAAAMDGIAVRAADTVGAGETTPIRLDSSAYAVVDTGDPLEPGFDAVIMREQVHLVDSDAEIRAAASPYQHVRSIGEDVTATELLVPEGHRLRAVDLAAIGSSGAVDVTVRRAPRVAVIPTGDELRPIGAEPGTGEIPDTNSLMLALQAEEAGCEARRLPIQPDDPETIAGAVREAAANADLVLIVAGSSAGRDDYTAAVVERAGSLAVHGVAVKPGHPVVLGVVDETPVIGVPGYPVSAALTFDIFATPLLAALEGASPSARPRAQARLARKLASTMGMEDWVRVRLGRVAGELVVTPLARGAGILTSLLRADGLLRVAAEREGHHAGEKVEVELLRAPEEVDRTIVAIGSHDLVLDLAASHLRAADPSITLASSNAGSLGGLVALRDGLCHLAGSHLLDPATGEYTLPYVERVLPGREVVVIRLVHREQGLIVGAGNPHGLAGIADLARPGLRYVNRQRGAGTRVLLDFELARHGIDAERLGGYEREEYTHLAVAAAVAAGRADCGLGVLAAARAFRLEFVPVAREPYDLVLTAETYAEPVTQPLFELLGDERFGSSVEALGGYDAGEMGRRVA